MSEEELNINYIREKTGLVENDELIPIILEIIKDSYKAGLCQLEFDNTMGLIEENQSLKKQLEYLRSGEYYNQLRFERDMLQYVADNGKVSQEDKTFIDMTHRNTELLEVIEEVREYIEDWLFNAGGNGASMNYEDINELLQILDKAKN